MNYIEEIEGLLNIPENIPSLYKGQPMKRNEIIKLLWWGGSKGFKLSQLSKYLELRLKIKKVLI